MKHDFPISQLRVVTINHHNDGTPSFHPSTHMMHQDQVETFVKATIALHHSPGINPHNGAVTNNLWSIEVSRMETETLSYWWCVPDLGRNRDPNGAQLNPIILVERVWAHPKLLEQERMYDEYDD